MPAGAVLAQRRKTRQLMVRNVGVGSDHPISVQSMTTTKTADVERHPAADRRAGRRRCRYRPGAPCRASGRRRRAGRDRPGTADPGHRRHPLPAQVRCSPRSTPAAPRCGVNPGNFSKFDEIRVAESPRPPPTPACRSASASTPARWTSDMREVRQGHPRGAGGIGAVGAFLFEEHGFGDIKIRSSTMNPVVMIDGLRQLGRPVRLSAAPRRDRGRARPSGTVKSAVAFGALLAGASATPIGVRSRPAGQEVKVGNRSWSARPAPPRLEIVSCPSCGRAQVDVYKLAKEVTAGLEGMRGAAAGRRDGLRGQRSGEGPRGRPGRRLGQRQGHRRPRAK